MATDYSINVEGRYGKGKVNVFRVQKNSANKFHDILDTDVEVSLQGDLRESYASGDNALVVPTDTVKNICYVVSREKNFLSIEDYGLALARHFLREYGHLFKVMVTLKENLWKRVSVDGELHEHCFLSEGPEKREAVVTVERCGRTTVVSGIRDLKVLKTTQSGFTKFHQCKHTTLEPTEDRIVATSIEADFHFNTSKYIPEGRFHLFREAARTYFIKTFAGPAAGGIFSKSVQETMYLMGKKVLDNIAEIERIDMFLPNIHHLTFDLARFGLKNDGEIFYRIDAPSGYIRCTVSRNTKAKL